MAAGHDVQHPVDCLAGNPGAAAGLAHFRPALALVLRPKPMQHEGVGPDTAALLARVPAAIAPPAISAVLSVLAVMASPRSLAIAACPARRRRWATSSGPECNNRNRPACRRGRPGQAPDAAPLQKEPEPRQPESQGKDRSNGGRPAFYSFFQNSQIEQERIQNVTGFSAMSSAAAKFSRELFLGGVAKRWRWMPRARGGE